MSRLVLAAGYVLYAAGATCLLFLVVVINSQGARPGGVGVPFLLVVALLSGAAMASVGLLFLQRVRWATAASVTLAACRRPPF